MGFRAGGVAILLLCFTLFSQIVKADQGWLMRIFECEEVDDCEEKGAVMVSYPRLEYESRHVPAHFAPLIKSNTLFKVEFSRPLQNCGGTISALYVQNGHFNTIHSECHLKIHFCGREFIPTNFDCFNRIGRTISFERVQDSEDGPDLDDYCDVDDDKVISISYLWRSHQNFESKYDENSTLPIFHIDVSEFGFIDMKCNDYVPSVSNIDVKDSIINFFIMSKTRSWIEFHEALTSRSPVFPCELFNVICDFREMTPFVSKIIASTFPEKSFEIVYNAIFPSLTSLRICPPPSHNAPFESIVFQDTGSRLEDLDLCRLKSFDWMLAISSLTKTLISLRITHSTIVHQISSFFIAYKVESISLMKSEFVPGSLHQNFEPEFPKLMRFESESFTGSLKFLLNSINIISIECSQCNLLDLDWMPRATMSIEKIILPMNFLSSNIVSHWIWNAPNLAVINLIKNPLYILVSDLSPLINPKLNVSYTFWKCFHKFVFLIFFIYRSFFFGIVQYGGD